MKKLLIIISAFFMLTACEETPQSEENVDAGGYDSEVYVKQVNIGKHEYYLVYATCDGRPGATVYACTKNHCFLRHSPDCPCQKVQPSASDVLTEDAEDSTDPFNW